MKISKDKSFTPITLTIESQAELDYLFALSQCSVQVARSNASELGFTLSTEAEDVQMPLYYTLQEARNK